jgi:adenylylsulfate kinase-like enzyme
MANSFLKNVDENDIQKANKEIQDFLLLTQLSGADKSHFLNRVRQNLTKRNIFLDYLDNC